MRSGSRSSAVTTRRRSSSASSGSKAMGAHSGASTPDMANKSGLSVADFSVGDRIAHDKYGLGTVTEIHDKGPKSIITVDFGSDGVKRLLLRMAPIEKL